MSGSGDRFKGFVQTFMEMDADQARLELFIKHAREFTFRDDFSGENCWEWHSPRDQQVALIGGSDLRACIDYMCEYG